MGESLLTLAALAGQMVVDAAAGDRWEKAERGCAQLLGRGNAKQAKLVRRWLEETHAQLSREAGGDTGMIRTALAGRWAGRWADLLEEDPDAEAELRALVQENQAAQAAGEPPASGPAGSADSDVSD